MMNSNTETDNGYDRKDLFDEITRLRKHVNQLQNTIAKLQNPDIRRKCKIQRDFNFSKHNVRHVALKIIYLGWDYDGLASQEDTNKTIEAALFDAFIKTRLIQSRQSSNYHRCGRTDKGVSAFSQVISIDLRTNLKCGLGVKKYLNADGDNLSVVNQKNFLYLKCQEDKKNQIDSSLNSNVLTTNILVSDTCNYPLKNDLDNMNNQNISSSNLMNDESRLFKDQRMPNIESNTLDIYTNNLTETSHSKTSMECFEPLVNNSDDEVALNYIDYEAVESNDIIGKDIDDVNSNEVPYVRMLNKVLPDDIRVIGWAPVDNNFSARFNCIQRTYKYYLPASNLDIELMMQAGNYLIGEHDFQNLCKMDVNNGVVNYKRSILSVQIIKCSGSFDSYDLIEITIVGLAFLWHQIRCIISILILVGKKLELPEIILELLNIEKNPRKPQYTMAADFPLVLFDCQYENVNWIIKPDDIQEVINTLQSKWTYFSIRTRIIKNMLENLEAKIDYPLHNQINLLLPSSACKNYKNILKREKCESLEDRLKVFKKRKLLKKLNINNS